MFQKSRSCTSLSKKRWISACTIIRNRQKAERLGKEHYPELISRILLYIEDNLSILQSDKSDTEESRICKKGLDTLVLNVLKLVTKFSVLEIILEANGWRENTFEDTEEKPFDVISLKSSLKILYYSHIWIDYTDSHGGEGYPTPRGSARSSPRLREAVSKRSPVNVNTVAKCNVVSHNDDRLAASFCPNILHDLLTSVSEVSIGSPSGFRAGSANGRRNAPQLQPKHVQVEGACLLADISGFTKMSAKFCERGLSGLDDLHNATSGFLGRYVQIVYAHGGDVIAFAGDALLCIFVHKSRYKVKPDKEFSVIEQCCVRAANCALALVEVHTDMLSSHVAVSCGEMQFASLGGYKNEWTFILIGEPIRMLSSCIDEAATKEVGVTKAVYDNVIKVVGEGNLNATETKSGNYLIQHGDGDSLITTLELRNRFKMICRDANEVRAMRQFVPRPVLHAIKYGTLDTISELREVITVFLKLDTYCPVDNANPSSLQPFFHMAQQALFAVGGFMRQFLIDDKGCVLIAMWGVPSFTYTNNCARSCAFALSVHKGVLELGHKCSIGITCGDVFCGNVGSLARRDFVGIGATVNLAARLMGKSKGKIYMDERVYGNVKKSLPDLKKSEGMKLKGYEDLVYAQILDGTEEFEINTKGTVQSAYVQSHIANKVMQILSKICHPNPDVPHSYSGAMSEPKTPPVRPSSVADMSKFSSNWRFLYPPDQAMTHAVSMKSPMKNKIIASVECIVIEAQSGGGKSAIALLFSGFSSKMLMPTYTVKLKSEDKHTKHSIYRKMFPQLIHGNGSFKTEEEQRYMLNAILQFCDWPGRCPVETRVLQLASALGLEWSSTSAADPNGNNLGSGSNSGSGSMCINTNTNEKGESMAEILLRAGDEALVLSDVMYFLLGQRPCSIILEHSHFADELSWSDICRLMDKPMSVAILITARVGSREEEVPPEEVELTATRRRASSVTSLSSPSITPTEAGEGTIAYLKERKFSKNRAGSVLDLNASGVDATPNGSVLRRKNTMRITKQTERFTEALKVGKRKPKSQLRTSFDLDEPLKENKLAYDRAHHTESYSQLIAHPNTTKLELQPLSFDEIGMLLSVDLHWHETDFCDGLIENIEKITFGNPYWCKEVAQFIMVRGQDKFLKDPIAALSTVVVTKVGKLTIDQQVVLKSASIIGEEFSVDILHLALPPRIAESMIDSLMYLSDHNFMTRISSDPPTYGFPNVIIKGILHDLSPPSERTKVHLSIAQQVEGMNGHDLEPFYEILSWHYGRCEDCAEKHLFYHTKSAEKALKNHDFDDLYDYIHECVGLWKLNPNQEILQGLWKILDNGINSAKNSLEKCDNENEISFIEEYLDLMLELDAGVREKLEK